MAPSSFARRAAFSIYLASLASCSSGDEAPAQAAGGPIFGGSPAGAAGASEDGAAAGAQNEGQGGSSNGVGGSGSDLGSARCSGVPIGAELRVDDFEDGNEIPRAAPDRLSFWAITHDETEGVLTPESTPLPVVGGAAGTDYALHVTAEGFAEWGVNLDAHLRTPFDGLNCPYNAGNTRGVGLYLKGNGRVRVGASTAATVATEFGGVCDPELQTCWDAHMKLVPLEPDWTYEEITWDSLGQAGWGTYAAFDPAQLMTLRLGALPQDLPLDVWVDEIVLLPLDEATPSP